MSLRNRFPDAEFVVVDRELHDLAIFLGARVFNPEIDTEPEM
jgi:hypothetical protein